MHMTLARTMSALFLAGVAPLAMSVIQTPSPNAAQPSTDTSTGVMAKSPMPEYDSLVADIQVRGLAAQLRQNLKALENETDIATIHKDAARDRELIEQLQKELDDSCRISPQPMSAYFGQGLMMPGPEGDMSGKP